MELNGHKFCKQCENCTDASIHLSVALSMQGRLTMLDTIRRCYVNDPLLIGRACKFRFEFFIFYNVLVAMPTIIASPSHGTCHKHSSSSFLFFRQS